MFVYIMANARPTLYVGVSNNLLRRVYEHKQELVDDFTKKYHLHKLVYFEIYQGEKEAIHREKMIKNLHRNKKLQLIESVNPKFEDLFDKLNG